MADRRPLFAHALGASYDRLPQPVRAMHDIAGVRRATGRCAVVRGKSLVARLLCSLARLPGSTADTAVTVEIATAGTGEIWCRRFGRHRLTTRLDRGPKEGFVRERLGPVTMTMCLRANDGGLSMRSAGMAIFGVALPKPLRLAVRASERAADGRFHFDVVMRLPLVGGLIAYRGWLMPDPQPPAAAAATPPSGG